MMLLKELILEILVHKKNLTLYNKQNLTYSSKNSYFVEGGRVSVLNLNELSERSLANDNYSR